MRCSFVVLTAGCWLATLSTLPSFADPLPAAPRWTQGTIWELSVERYSRDWLKQIGTGRTPGATLLAGPVAKYTTRLTVAGEATVEGVECWKLDFGPDQPASRDVATMCSVFVSKQNGNGIKTLVGPTRTEWPTVRVGDALVASEPYSDFPVEFFNSNPTPASARPGSLSRAMFAQRKVPGADVREFTLVVGAVREYAVKQVWRAGDALWCEYERFYRDHRDLRATARLVSVGPRSSSGLEPSDIVQQKGGSDSPLRGLRYDARLQSPLSGTVEKPSVEHILQRIRQATRLQMVCDMNSDADKPFVMSISYHQTPAWSAMEQLAKSELVEGTWEPIEGGYRLVRHKRFTPEPIPSEPRVTSLTVWYIAAAGVALAAIGAVLFRWRRRPGVNRSQTPATLA